MAKKSVLRQQTLFDFLLKRLKEANGAFVPQSELSHELIDARVLSFTGKTPQHSAATDFYVLRHAYPELISEEHGKAARSARIIYKRLSNKRYLYKYQDAESFDEDDGSTTIPRKRKRVRFEQDNVEVALESLLPSCAMAEPVVGVQDQLRQQEQLRQQKQLRREQLRPREQFRSQEQPSQQEQKPRPQEQPSQHERQPRPREQPRSQEQPRPQEQQPRPRERLSAQKQQLSQSEDQDNLLHVSHAQAFALGAKLGSLYETINMATFAKKAKWLAEQPKTKADAWLQGLCQCNDISRMDK